MRLFGVFKSRSEHYNSSLLHFVDCLLFVFPVLLEAAAYGPDALEACRDAGMTVHSADLLSEMQPGPHQKVTHEFANPISNCTSEKYVVFGFACFLLVWYVGSASGRIIATYRN